jgi:hypothetical protein
LFYKNYCTTAMHSLVPHPGGTGTASVAAGPAGG